eukprot:gene48272-30328_t
MTVFSVGTLLNDYASLGTFSLWTLMVCVMDMMLVLEAPSNAQIESLPYGLDDSVPTSQKFRGFLCPAKGATAGLLVFFMRST